MNRRAFVVGVVTGTVGLAGCEDEGDDVADDYDPELAQIRIRNEDDAGHAFELAVYEYKGENRPDPSQSVVEEAVDLPAGDSLVVSDFPGRGDQRYEVRWRVDGGEERSLRTDPVRGCSQLVVRIGNDGTATVSLEGKTVCYGQDG